MKKRKPKKTFIKEEHKKMNYLNIVIAIVIPILSIIIATYMAEKSYLNEKRTTPPIFYLTQDPKNNNFIKIDNVGGFASYLKFTKNTALKFTFGDKIACLNINYTDKNELFRLVPNNEGKENWNFYQIAKTANHDRIKEVFKRTTKNAGVESSLELLNIEDYYTLTYYDYENESHTLTYKINKNGRGVYDGEPNYENCFGVGGMVIYSDEVFYERLEGYLENEIDLYRQYLEWQKEN